jgi:hypothetical protein
VDNDNIVAGLQEIVQEFSEEMLPMAVPMAEQLVRAFEGYAAAAGDGGDELDEAQYSAAQTLETLNCLIEAAQGSQEILERIEPVVLPVMQQVLTEEEEHFDYIDNVVEMLSFLTYFVEDVRPNIWSLAGPLISSLGGWAYDYISEIQMPVLTYLSKDPTTFMQTSYKVAALSLVWLFSPLPHL